MNGRIFFYGICILGFMVGCKPSDFENWDTYLSDLSSSQYSKINQIDTNNVMELQPAWIYESGDAHPQNLSQIQCNPLIIDGILYATNPKLKLFALNASTGKEIWKFDPFEGRFNMFGMGVNRGLNYWEKGEDKRILYATGSKLFAVNAKTGEPVTTFGESGYIDLKKGLGRQVDSLFLVNNTPGVVYRNLLILGSRVSESVGHVPGHIRAYDVISGEMKWIFHTIPHPGEYGYSTWPKDAYMRVGGANAWAGFSLDKQEDMVYVPTGSASFDFYGGDRLGSNLFANSIIALKASTGELIWYYQTVHHDIWDRDLPAPPNLIDITINGERIKALAQISKSGYVFLLNRITGEPIYSIEEVSVASSDLAGEEAWPTQPIPQVIPPFARIRLTENDLANRTSEVAEYSKKVWENSLKGEQFIPPSMKGTIIFPGFDGGGEWGGAAFDHETGLLLVNSNEVPWLAKMIKQEAAPPGQVIYTTMCQACHGTDMQGGQNSMFGNVASLVGVASRKSYESIDSTIRNGRNLMPSFSVLTDQQIHSVIQFITGIEETGDVEEALNIWPYPYSFRGYEKLLAPDGFPIIKPPWGQLTAIDLVNAKIKWQVPLGNHNEFKIREFPVTGTENYGGPIITAGGIVFIAATMDARIRAFHLRTGDLLWEYELPAAGFATPSTYMVDGVQYVVIACGGGKLGTASGDQFITFKLGS